MTVRIAVGAVYRIVPPYFCTSSHQRPRCGVSGVPSYMTWVAPLGGGPYTMYEWPGTQPMSAVHQKTSVSGLWSNTALIVYDVWVRNPPVVCRMPFGLPVVPEV